MTWTRALGPLVVSCLVLGTANCGAEEADPTAETALPMGTLASAPFEAASSSGFSLVYPPKSSNNASDAPLAVTTLVFASKPRGIDYCGSYIVRRKDEFIVLVQVAAQGEAVSAGAFPLAAPGTKASPATFTATAVHLDGSCRGEGDAAAEDATQGTLTLDSISSSEARGSIDIVFPSGAVKGTFATPLCAKTVETISQTSSTCMD